MAALGIPSLLFGSKLRVAILVVVLLAALTGGAFAAGVLNVPSIVAVDNTFGEVTDESTTIETDVVIQNPNPVGIDLQGVTVNYTVSMNEIEVAEGGREGVSIGRGNSSIALETRMFHGAISPWWVSHIERGERTELAVDATVSSRLLGMSRAVGVTHDIETDLLGAFASDETRPVNADHALVDDPVLYINETDAAWGAVRDDATPIEMTFLVYNPQAAPYTITELRYEITMNDIAMGEGETHDPHVIAPQTTELIPLTTTIDNRHLDDWWVSHLDDGVHDHQVSDLRIEFHAVIELPSGDEVTVSLDELTYEELIETDILDEGLEHDAEVNDEDDDEDDDDEDDDEDDDNDGDDDDEDDDDNGILPP